MDIQPFTVAVPAETLDDIQERLARTRWPDEVEEADWDYGVPLDYMHEVIEHWRTRFDWRDAERQLNAFANYRADVDGIGIHFIHERGRGPNPIPLIITHGWPSSVYEMLKLIPLLTDPAAHGGDAADSFDVVIPSVPGHGFSDRPARRGFEDRRVAQLWVQLMAGLGYQHFGAHAHDLGASISGFLCLDFPEHVIGYHTTNPGNPGPYLGTGAPELTQAERDWLDLKAEWWRDEYGYAQIQGTRPQTLAYGLNDSPAGLAAWIIEKWHAWTVPREEALTDHFTMDELLATVMIYWVTETVNSAARYYREELREPGLDDRVRVPTGVALTTQAFERPPRAFVERLHTDIRHWIELPRGGHFVALEEPELVAESIRSFFRELR